ncbi:hypothetical protein Celaphus_00009567, partial [Cervus elaphus hippelaphus]
MQDIAFLSDVKVKLFLKSSFPGNLHLVLVLRPTSFLQRTFTDIGFRFSQEDFMLKLPVVMLSSVSDLLTYIDDKQLTTELGGTLQYCHSEWITFRNAIENFALTVKDTAQMLQSFGTELAESELPGDIPAIEEILAIRAERYHLLKVQMQTIQLKLENIRSIFENQQAGFRNLTDKHALCRCDAGLEVRDWSSLPAPLTLGVGGLSSRKRRDFWEAPVANLLRLRRLCLQGEVEPKALE